MPATSQPTDLDQLATQLREIGYQPDALPKPLTWDAAIDTVGHRQASSATPEFPCCLGIATLIAIGNNSQAPAVIHLEGRGHYYGIINHDLFFTDPKPQSHTESLLHYANNYYVLAQPDCPRETIIRLMRTIDRACTSGHG